MINIRYGPKLDGVNTNIFERKFKSLLPKRFKKVLLNLLCNRQIGFLIKFSGVKFNLFGGIYDYSLVDGRTACKIFFGFWESAEIRYAKEYAGNENIVELGSSIGVTYGVLINIYPDSKYICVEAHPKVFQILKKLVHFTGNLEKATLINKALSYSREKEVRFIEDSNMSSGKIGVSDEYHSPVIQVVTLNEIIKDHLKEEKYTLISDIEGAEADIFFEDAEALKNCTKIICELDNTNKYPIESQVNQLLSIGFLKKEQYSNVFVFQRP